MAGPRGSEDNEILLPDTTIQLLAGRDATSIQGRWGLEAEEGTPVQACCLGSACPLCWLLLQFICNQGNVRSTACGTSNQQLSQIWSSKVNKTLL